MTHRRGRRGARGRVAVGGGRERRRHPSERVHTWDLAKSRIRGFLDSLLSVSERHTRRPDLVIQPYSMCLLCQRTDIRNFLLSERSCGLRRRASCWLLAFRGTLFLLLALNEQNNDHGDDNQRDDGH